MRRGLNREIEEPDGAVEDFDTRSGARGPRVRRERPRILHQDERVVLVEQPTGAEPMIGPDGTWRLFEGEDEVAELAQMGPLYAVYPIEEGCTGVVLLARSSSIRSKLVACLGSGELEITCLALVRGYVSGDVGTFEGGPTGQAEGGAASVEKRESEPCRTDWRLRDSFVGFALLECRPRTAIRDQIRTHLLQAGWPLAVDPLNRGPAALMLSSFKADYHRSRRHAERPLIDRASMHFESVVMNAGWEGPGRRFESPMARDFRAAVHQLGRFGRMPSG